MRSTLRLPALLGLLLLAAVLPPAAHAASSADSHPRPVSPTGSPFTPPQQPSLAAPPAEQTTTINSTRPDTGGLGRSTLLLLVGVALAMIAGVGGLIWYEGRRSGRSLRKRRRQRMRSGRTPQPQAAAAAGRRGPPPPPRKRRQQAKKKKR
jgi:hypothetical protein